MMTTPDAHENTNSALDGRTSIVPPSVLLIGKKHAADYIAPGLLRLNNTGKLIIKATGSLSIVTAVDVAEMIKRDVQNVITETISLGTDSLVISTGESKKMSCIEIKLSKLFSMAVLPAQATEVNPNQIQAPDQTSALQTKKKTTRKKAKSAAGKKKVARKKKATTL